MTEWSTACPNWEERILYPERFNSSLVPDLPLFREEADWALRVFKRLRMPDVIGQPTMAEACGEWVFAIVEALFGSYDAATNKRMIQEYFLLVPKKNGKTSVSAAIMVVAIILNRRPAAEFLLIAPTKKIADISFKQAENIIKADEEIKKLFLIQRHIRTITHLQTGATILIQASDTDVITGSKSTGILVDETHEFAKISKAADVFVEIRGALNSRPDGFMLQISTQSKEPPAGVFKQELDIARDVRDGKLVLPKPLLPIIYELPLSVQSSEDWQREKYWPLVNPNWGRSVDPDFLRTTLVKAKRDGAAALALAASQFWNVEIGAKLRSNRWAGVDFWLQNAAPALDFESILKLCEVVVFGIDGGGLDDLLGLAMLGRHRITKDWLLWCHAWAHPIVLERRKDIAPVLQDFVNAGDLTIVDRPGDDVEAVADIIMKVERLGLLPEKAAVGVDAAGIGAIVSELGSRKLPAEKIISIPQGWQLNGAIKDTERALAGGTLTHCDQPIMVWSASNAKVEPAGNAVKITKQAAGTAKIDPLMATFDAVALMSRNPIASGSGSYIARANQVLVLR